MRSRPDLPHRRSRTSRDPPAGRLRRAVSGVAGTELDRLLHIHDIATLSVRTYPATLRRSLRSANVTAAAKRRFSCGASDKAEPSRSESMTDPCLGYDAW